MTVATNNTAGRLAWTEGIVELFLDTPLELQSDWRALSHDQEGYAQGLCHEASRDFMEWCKHHAVCTTNGMRETTLIEIAGFETYCGQDCHWVVLLWDTIVVDLTARQFDPELPFPHIYVVESNEEE